MVCNWRIFIFIFIFLDPKVIGARTQTETGSWDQIFSSSIDRCLWLVKYTKNIGYLGLAQFVFYILNQIRKRKNAHVPQENTSFHKNKRKNQLQTKTKKTKKKNCIKKRTMQIQVGWRNNKARQLFFCPYYLMTEDFIYTTIQQVYKGLGTQESNW